MSTENTQEKIEQLNRLRRQARAWRIGTTLGSVVVTLLFLVGLRSVTLRLFQPGPTHDQFVAEYKSGLQQQVVPQVKELTLQTANQLVPRVKEEVVKLQARAPELVAALTVELQLFQKSMPERGEKILRASFDDVVKQREAKVRELYPDLSQENLKAVMTLLRSEGESRLTSIANQVVSPYEQAMTKLVEDLNKIRDTEPVQVAGNEPAWELATLCAGMLQTELQRTSPPEYQQFLTAAFTEAKK